MYEPSRQHAVVVLMCIHISIHRPVYDIIICQVKLQFVHMKAGTPEGTRQPPSCTLSFFITRHLDLSCPSLEPSLVTICSIDLITIPSRTDEPTTCIRDSPSDTQVSYHTTLQAFDTKIETHIYILRKITGHIDRATIPDVSTRLDATTDVSFGSPTPLRSRGGE